VVTGQRPVDTLTRIVSTPAADTAPLRLLAAASRTPGRPGSGSGVPLSVISPPRPGPDVVLVAPTGLGYRAAAELVRGWLGAAGAARVAAVLIAGDEGVLLSRRVSELPAGVPVVDDVDTVAALAAERVAVEAGAAGSPVLWLTDPLRLVSLFGLRDGERRSAEAMAATVLDSPNAVVALDRAARSVLPAVQHDAAEDDGVRTDRLSDDLVPVVLAGGLGAVRRFGRLPAHLMPLDDLWLVDLAAVGAAVEGRTTAGSCRQVVFAAPGAATGAPGAEGQAHIVASSLGVPTRLIGTEAAAARAGALTTPGARPDAVVLDLGAGTLDSVDAGGRELVAAGAGELVAAGAGELVTAAVATALGVSRGAADWIKRGPSRRLESPHVLLGEDGRRDFTDRPAPGDAVGALTVPGPAGLLPFSRELSPAEWRALRLRIKRAALGDNLARLVGAMSAGVRGRDVVLVGGVSGDPEILRVLDAALDGAAVGRADVAGELGHRWAVAYGLTLLA
jgi:hypothetical protein